MRGATKSEYCGLDSNRRSCRRSTCRAVSRERCESSCTVHVSSWRACTVAENRSCRVNPDTALGVARAWIEASIRTLSRRQLPCAGGLLLVAERIDYDRTTDGSGSIIRSQRLKRSRTPVTTVWQSVPADTLATHGYAVDNAGGMTFYAPDAAVLLSRIVRRRHTASACCAAPPGHRADSSSAFDLSEPSKTRSGLRDITGVFWLDRATSELRSVEFQYTNLDAEVAAAGAGGSVDFVRLATGEWVVSRWSLHTPLLTVAARVAGDRPATQVFRDSPGCGWRKRLGWRGAFRRSR